MYIYLLLSYMIKKLLKGSLFGIWLVIKFFVKSYMFFALILLTAMFMGDE